MFRRSENIRYVGDTRDFPYPYKAMLSICSDLDETPNTDTYFNISQYLNTDQITPIGEGVSLEVGNTIYFDMPKGQFSYCNTDNNGRDRIHKLIRSGHIDVIHSFGDYAESREKIAEHIETLKNNSCELKVWVDHAVAPSNFGHDIMLGQGDVLSSATYHADITLDYGIKYIWMGRVTSVIGQGVKRNYRGLLNRKHFLKSMKTIAKEMTKVFLSKIGSKKYRLHKYNALISTTQLRSGQTVFEFIRSNPFWGGVSECETAYGIKHVLNRTYLDALIRSNGYSVLYTHLGKIKSEEEPFDHETRRSFELLSKYYNEKKIVVTTTRRLLDYCLAVKNIRYSTSFENGRYIIMITSHELDNELSGITFYVPFDVNKVEIKCGERMIGDIQYNEPDETGMKSVSIPWKKLEYPL
jgi:effector-binding domain-containing protein